MNIPTLSLSTDCNDVFNSFLVKNATYDGYDEIPRIITSNLLPDNLISFSTARKNKTKLVKKNTWVHFYENDSTFECFWRNPQKYLPLLKRYSGVISPDFSLYYDMPLNMQKYNTYRGKALAHWLHENDIEIIPNVRWGDDRTYNTACLGVEHNKTIAIGTHGCIKTKIEKQLFIDGFDYVINKLEPKTIIVYGRMPDKIFCLAKMSGISLLPFESEFSLSHKKEVN